MDAEDRLSISLSFDARQINRDLRAFFACTLDFDFSPRLLNEVMHCGQSNAVASLLGGKEWLEQTVACFLVHTKTGVNHHIRCRIQDRCGC